MLGTNQSEGGLSYFAIRGIMYGRLIVYSYCDAFCEYSADQKIASAVMAKESEKAPKIRKGGCKHDPTGKR
jgi:hypothetical protein